MKYLQLFTLELIHDYYADRRCPDFEIEPTPETQRLLGNCRSVLKPLPNGIRVLTLAADQNTPFIPLPAEATFGFHLWLQNPSFILFTDFAEIAPVAAPLYTNDASNPELKLVSREINSTEHFVVRQPAKKDTFVLSGRPLDGIQLAAFSVDGLGTASKPVGYDEAAKVICVNSYAAKAGDPFTVTYPTAPQLTRGVFADVEIKYDNTMAGIAGGDTKFQVVFKAKKVRWKYYVVTDKTDNGSNIPAIEDKDRVIVFDAAGLTDLTQSPDPSDQIANELAKQYPNMQTFRFLSNAMILCQEAARKAIQFQMNGDKVVDALPNPALQNYVVEIRDSKKEDSLYHIVKYFTH